MIYDRQNMFFKDQALSATTLTSDIIDVGPGEASDPLHMVVDVTPDAGAGKVTATLQTSDDSTFSTYSVLGEYESKTYTTSFTVAADTLAEKPIGTEFSGTSTRGTFPQLKTSAEATTNIMTCPDFI